MSKPYQCRSPERVERVRRVLGRRQKDLTLILANVWDPHNVSAILRSCDAFGVLGVHLYYTTEAFPRLGRKSSASARKWIDVIRHQEAGAMVGGLREQGFQVLSTGFDDRALPLTEVDFTRPTAVVLGNEHRGVDQELDSLVPDTLYIPMQGMVQSLNVSVAAAVILYEAWRQRQAAGLDKIPALEGEELERLVREWCER